MRPQRQDLDASSRWESLQPLPWRFRLVQITGGVYVYFGITAEFQAGPGSKFAIGVMLLLRGGVSLLGIVFCKDQFAA